MSRSISRHESAQPLSRNQPTRRKLHALSRQFERYASPRRNPSISFTRLRRKKRADSGADQWRPRNDGFPAVVKRDEFVFGANGAVSLLAWGTAPGNLVFT